MVIEATIVLEENLPYHDKLLTESTTFRWNGSTCYKKIQTMKRGFSRGGINPRLRSSCRRQRNRSDYGSVVHVANYTHTTGEPFVPELVWTGVTAGVDAAVVVVDIDVGD